MKPNSHRRPSEDEGIEATAAAWLAQRDGGLSPAEDAEFQRWRSADPRHEATMAHLESTWTALQGLRDFRPEARTHPDRHLLRAPVARRPLFALTTIATTAIAAIVVFAAVWWNVTAKRGTDSEPQRYATTLDGFQRVKLSDGTSVELNSNSEVEVQFTSGIRRVRLGRGEAHFTVAKDPARPFMVEAGAVLLRAVGTAFNVRLGAADVEILVTEGKVEVGPERKRRDQDGAAQSVSIQSNRATTTAGPETSKLVLAGHRAVVSSVVSFIAPVVEKMPPEAVREALAWQEPRLVFRDTPLGEVITQFNRHNRVQLVLGDAELGSMPIGGSFQATNVGAFVRLLATSNDIVVDRRKADQIILRQGP